MKQMRVAASVLLLGSIACADADRPSATGPEFSFGSSGVVRVTNHRAMGPGSFHQAIQQANSDASIHKVEFARRLGTIALTEPVVYTGAQDLAIDGNQATIDGAALGAGTAGFAASGGGDLELRSLTVRRAPGPGIVVAVPATASGTVEVTVAFVTVSNNGSHGLLVNDQAEFFTDPLSTSEAGSDASLDVRILASRFSTNGFTEIDQDGIRLNEGGLGSLHVQVTGSRVDGNGGDGIEFDERSSGDVTFSVLASALEGNGSFTSLDFDDGIDIDEGGEGSIIGAFILTSANDNFEQGFDLNENGPGDLKVDMTLVEAIGNDQEGIEYEEDDDVPGGGDIVARLIGVTARGNADVDGDAGLKIREKGPGNCDAQLTGIDASANFVDGILLREDADGTLTGSIRYAVTNGNTGDGIEWDENAAGDLNGIVEKSTSSDNTVAGIRADQAGAGLGALQLTTVTMAGNAAGSVIANAGVTVTQTP